MSQMTETKRLRVMDWDKDKVWHARESVFIPIKYKKDGKTIKTPARYKFVS